MYIECGDLEAARKVFDEWPRRNVVSWDVMIAGYVDRGLNESALDLFQRMQDSDLAPNKAILSCILRACGGTGAVDGGRLVHDAIVRARIEEDAAMRSSIVDMYAKCGRLYEARQMVKMRRNRASSDVVSWGALIAGFAEHGDLASAIECLQVMGECGIAPNDAIFLNLINACSRSALAEEGLRFFESMAEVYGISRGSAHYSCMVDLFSRTGQLTVATDLLRSMPLSPTDAAFTSLLLHCRTHGNPRLGQRLCFQQLCL
jgi:pentatricopeptide repeat protein